MGLRISAYRCSAADLSHGSLVFGSGRGASLLRVGALSDWLPEAVPRLQLHLRHFAAAAVAAATATASATTAATAASTPITMSVVELTAICDFQHTSECPTHWRGIPTTVYAICLVSHLVLGLQVKVLASGTAWDRCQGSLLASDSGG